ncbi:hypothetical protein [Actinoplanes sp. NBRC 103695]|uniref:hypothetical protein n=1 Tax=Actinoplanes sp. NBRC 103695 TaxID=3032202 RepID=UPI0024A16E44|nr:hypothetical protein [Actinoplanes sp. NBRC 103695]GLY99861.1 hypothetical protein Acsp02_71140 [Actinoplanes sp. NBRC 103695]
MRPFALAGFIEGVEQANRTFDPPLHVECHELVDPDDETRGVVFIRVRASPLAPHQTNKRYYGRDECPTYRLAHAQVKALVRWRTARVDHAALSRAGCRVVCIADRVGACRPTNRRKLSALRPGRAEDDRIDELC